MDKGWGGSKIVFKHFKCLIDHFCIYIIVKIFRDNRNHGILFSPWVCMPWDHKCQLVWSVSLVISRVFLSVSHTPLPPSRPVYTFKDLAWRQIWFVVESRVSKHTSEDTQDSGVQFITPKGPRESVSNKDHDVSERPSFITPTLSLVTCSQPLCCIW